MAQYRATADRRLNSLLAVTAAGAALQQTKRWRPLFFAFMADRNALPINNAAKRALHPSVTFRKVTDAFRSIWGADIHALIRSFIGSGRLNGFSAHQVSLAPPPATISSLPDQPREQSL